MTEKKKTATLLAAALVVTAGLGIAAATANGTKDVSQKTSESSIVTNGNGTVSRTFTECTVTTNGSLVTEHRRETRTTTDNEGNMLESSTSEYAQSYSVGGNWGLITVTDADTAASVTNADSFLGLKFGSVLKATNFVSSAEEPTLLRARFAPKKKLSGFDDYYVFVTPKTHRVAKVYACAKQAVEPETSWRRHYLIEALEKRYQTWARPQSAFRPIYSFDIGGGRYISTVLAGATPDYGTVIVAWDDAQLTLAADETEAIRAEALKAASEKRTLRVNDAADAF